ncbi:acyl-CoA thioesterase [Parasulfitobacter algicola]|uniref:Acyl-CoA thioesterase n=1 Tax=Parasulfitobacter algicola TaxID=2614809 RepID=A0ABX2IZS1_9RHOB|nr:thioesterase family protein [Sulfitobacter algicola]NSX56286.1 acyl-CoA thioesterase [Sulfitobacter algicola]
MAFTVRQKILFKHCDPAGIVFYPRYFEIMNDCTEAFFADALHWPFEELLKTAAIPTAQISAQFQAPSHHGDHLDIALGIARLGRSSVDLTFHATCGDETRFTAQSTLVHISQNGRSQSWPDALRPAFVPHIIGDQNDS